MSERKLGFFSKIKSKTPDSERGKAKIITIPFKYSGTGIHTLKYFEDYNLSLTQRLGKITVFGRALNRPEAVQSCLRMIVDIFKGWTDF